MLCLIYRPYSNFPIVTLIFFIVKAKRPFLYISKQMFTMSCITSVILRTMRKKYLFSKYCLRRQKKGIFANCCHQSVRSHFSNFPWRSSPWAGVQEWRSGLPLRSRAAAEARLPLSHKLTHSWAVPAVLGPQTWLVPNRLPLRDRKWSPEFYTFTSREGILPLGMSETSEGSVTQPW